MILPYRYEVLMRFTVVGDGLHAYGDGAMTTVHKIAAAIENADIPNVTDVSPFPASIVYLGKTDRLRIWPSDSPREITLDTRLADVGADNAIDIGDDLIDSAVYGDDWGRDWSMVIRHDPDATVRDLRDVLSSRRSDR